MKNMRGISDFNKKKFLNKFLIVAFAVLLFIFFNFFQKEIRNFGILASSPIQFFLWKAGDRVSDFLEAISEIKNLRNENEKLKKENQRLYVGIAELNSLKKENEILRTALNLNLEKEFNFKIAQVIGKEISQDVLIIKKGSKDGIKKDFPVITQERILVGQIADVYENFSKIKLLSAKDNSFAVKILKNDQEIRGMARGKGDFKLSLEFISSEKKIEVGEKIFTFTESKVFPENLLIGEVSHIQKSDVKPFQKIEIKPAISIEDLDFVFIIAEIY